MINRAQTLAIVAAAVLLPSCAARKPGTVRIASTIEASNENVAELYALALERAGIPVERKMRLGDANAVPAAFHRGEIDVFPLNVPIAVKRTVDHDATLLDLAPARISETLATSQFIAQKLYLVSTESCARLAPTLRLAATAEFIKPGGMLSRLQAAYSGFHFKNIVVCDPGTQTNLLNRDLADVSHISNVDPQVRESQFVLLRDEKHVFPLLATAPLMRTSVMAMHPMLRKVLNDVSRHLNLYAMQGLNMRRDLDGVTAADAAEEFADLHLKKR